MAAPETATADRRNAIKLALGATTLAAAVAATPARAQVASPYQRTFVPHRYPEQQVDLGAVSDFQAQKAGELVRAAGQPFTYLSFPQAAHAMHATDPATYAQALREWAASLPAS